jgi:hypothetical protein
MVARTIPRGLGLFAQRAIERFIMAKTDVLGMMSFERRLNV